MGCSPWGGEESDTTERLHFHFHFQWLGLSTLSAMAQIQSLIGQGTRIPQATQHAKANKQTNKKAKTTKKVTCFGLHYIHIRLFFKDFIVYSFIFVV